MYKRILIIATIMLGGCDDNQFRMATPETELTVPTRPDGYPPVPHKCIEDPQSNPVLCKCHQGLWQPTCLRKPLPPGEL